MPDLTSLASYDYHLPPDLVAQDPIEKRDASRLLVVDRVRQTVTHSTVSELPSFLNAGDCLVVNNSRVLPARLLGRRVATGGRWEGLYLGTDSSGAWQLIGQTRGYLRPGELVAIPAADDEASTLELRFEGRTDSGNWVMAPITSGDPVTLLQQFGRMPLPPYIRHGTEAPSDRERYQTVYASQPGSIAAPTAGLHFTPELLEACRDRGVERAEVTLHVGLGTFRPVQAEDIRTHSMHSEYCQVAAATMEQLQRTRQGGGRIVAVGTTSLRTLETAVTAAGWSEWSGESRLFVYPPYEFRAVDVLLTNFHLPKSTLLMLVSAFGGYDLIRRAYEVAITERYRFYSYGDAMLIL